jgi:hypothetical protein
LRPFKAARSLEHEKRPGANQRKADEMVDGQALAQIEHRKSGEHRKGNHLLDGLEFGRRINRIADPVGGNGKAVFDEGDEPAGQNHGTERLAGKF